MLDVTHEYYAGFVVDSSVDIKAPVLIFSTMGGTGIEEVAVKNPEKVFRQIIDPIVGLDVQAVHVILERTDIAEEVRPKICETLCDLYRFFKQSDASSAEINPFAMTNSGDIYALDCHITIDDNAVFRHPEFDIEIPRDMDRQPTQLEKLAWDQIEEGDYRGTGYFAQMQVAFDPNETYVGFHGLGGGGAMLGAAALINRGIKLANYADTSGDPPASKVYKVIKSIFSLPISAYTVLGACLANQEQWYHAFAIVKALREELQNRPGFPVVILLADNKEVEAIQILRDGLRDLDLRLEVYGRDHIYNSDFMGARLEVLMDEYLPESSKTSVSTTENSSFCLPDNGLIFRTRCAQVVIDYGKCEPAQMQTLNPKCGFACVKADRMYDRSILKIEACRPVLATPPEVAEKKSNESLSWEYACRAVGVNAISITVAFPGLEEFRATNQYADGV